MIGDILPKDKLTPQKISLEREGRLAHHAAAPLQVRLLTLPMQHLGQQQCSSSQPGWGIHTEARVQEGQLTDEAVKVKSSSLQ